MATNLSARAGAVGGDVHPEILADSRARFYLPELDVLRFFAFLVVFVFHLTFDTVNDCLARTGVDLAAHHHIIQRTFWAGASGVDLFFALSAYLITELLLRERAASGKVDVKSFYLRRILRIWPLYFFFLGCAYALSHYRTDFAEPGFYYIAMLLLVGNFAFAGAGLPVSIGHLWTICVEEQFYLAWPLVLRKVSRRDLTRVALAMLGVSATARLALSVFGLEAAAGLNTFAHLDPMAAGILLATVPRSRRAGLGLSSRVGLVVFGLGSWLLVAYFSHPPGLVSALTGIPVVALGSACLLVAALEARRAAGFMVNPVLIYLGKISYGLYIYHRLAIDLTLDGFAKVGNRNYGTEGWLLRGAFSLAFTIALAAASYRMLETPFLNLKRRFTHVQSRPV